MRNMESLLLIIFAFAGVVNITPIDAFHANLSRSRQKDITCRNVIDFIGGGMDEIDLARLQYEALIGPMIFTATTSTTTSKNKETSKPNNPKRVLTSSAKRRKEVEIGLLQSLEYSDDAIDELMSLWMTAECPSNRIGSQVLINLETDCSTGQEELTLRKIIDDSNMEWVEPMSRLSLLLYMKKEYKECQYWLSIILREKPWHFDALQLQLLLVLTATRHDVHSLPKEAIYWARKGLPPLHHTKRRKAWIENAIQNAKDSLHQLELQTDQIRRENTLSTENKMIHSKSILNPNSFTSPNNGVWQ